MKKNIKLFSSIKLLRRIIFIKQIIFNACKKIKHKSGKIKKRVTNNELVVKFANSFTREKKAKKYPLLKLISESNDIFIEALYGQKIIIDYKNIFQSIDQDFNNWNLNKPGEKTDKVFVDVYEMIEDATFLEMFNSLNRTFDDLILSQEQIIYFCLNYFYLLNQEKYNTFFLIKEGTEYFVVSIFLFPEGLHARINKVDDVVVWDGDFHCRLVVPRTT
jgi:hypothetical protein